MDINTYINKNYESLKKKLRATAKDADNNTYEELFHECLLIFLEHKDSQKAIDNNKARFFIARIMLNQWRSNTSKFKRYYKKNVELTVLPDDINIEYDYEKDFYIETILEGLNEMIEMGGKSLYRAYIIIYYYSSNCNFNEIERRYDIKSSTARHSFNQGIEELKKIIIKNDNNNFYDDDELSNAWVNLGSSHLIEAISKSDRLFHKERRVSYNK